MRKKGKGMNKSLERGVGGGGWVLDRDLINLILEKRAIKNKKERGANRPAVKYLEGNN